MQRRKLHSIYAYFYLSKYEVVAYVDFIRQSVMLGRLEIIVLRIAA